MSLILRPAVPKILSLQWYKTQRSITTVCQLLNRLFFCWSTQITVKQLKPLPQMRFLKLGLKPPFVSFFCVRPLCLFYSRLVPVLWGQSIKPVDHESFIGSVRCCDSAPTVAFTQHHHSQGQSLAVTCRVQWVQVRLSLTLGSCQVTATALHTVQSVCSLQSQWS